MSKLTRTIPAAILAATALMAAPSGAGAAAQVGQTVDPAGSFCSPNNLTWLQSISPSNGSFVVPFDGVITSWSYQGGAFPPAQLKLKVGRVGATSLTIVGDSAPANPVANQLKTFPTQVTAHDDDVIGFLTTNGQCAALGQVGYAAVFANGDIPPPAGTGSPITTETNVHLDLSALLESDCDQDGLGDETQDQDLSSCGPGNPPGNPPGIPPATPPGTGPGTGPGTQAQATCKGLAATIVGTNGNDVRTGSQGRDVIAGLGGNDTLSGLGGNDVICGGAGKDTLKGGKGKDKLYGQKGKDTLRGGGGKDKCIGGKGNDTASKCEVEKSI